MMTLEIIVRKPDIDTRLLQKVIYYDASPEKMDKFWKKIKEAIEIVEQK